MTPEISKPLWAPQSFAQAVCDLVRAEFKRDGLTVVEPMKVQIDDRTINLENLHRMVVRDLPNWQSIARTYFANTFLEMHISEMDVSLDMARRYIVPLIQPASALAQDGRSPKDVVHLPFVNGCVITYSTKTKDSIIPIPSRQIDNWKITPDEVDIIARENLLMQVPKRSFTIYDPRQGGRWISIDPKVGLGATRLLLPGLYRDFACEMKGDFYVAIPSQDNFVALTFAPEPLVAGKRTWSANKFQTAPNPITPKLFVVTRDGIAGTID